MRTGTMHPSETESHCRLCTRLQQGVGKAISWSEEMKFLNIAYSREGFAGHPWSAWQQCQPASIIWR